MRRLKLELKQTMEMYSTACKEALTAKQKVKEIVFCMEIVKKFKTNSSHMLQAIDIQRWK